MKSLVELLEHLLLDCERRSGATLRRDVETLRARVKNEGDSFITITLPKFCQDFERSLEEGRIGPGLFTSFGKKRKSAIPEFLQGLLSGVFDSDGSLLTMPSVDCILFIRQVCLFGKKIERPCSESRIVRTIEGYVKCDDEIADLAPNQFLRVFKLVAKELLLGGAWSNTELTSRIVPRHGPGATCEHILGNQKYVHKRWHERLNAVGFTHGRFARCSSEQPADDERPLLVEPGAEEPVRVVTVPKTLKAPRVIAVEPVCMQYAQQGLARLLVEHLHSSRLTSGRINFRDQEPNQALALAGSLSGDLATLDLSEASDRVSIAHVEALLESCPDLRDYCFAARSTCARTPDGEIISLKKFASMGSALCFPIEAMVFFVSIITSRAIRAGICPTAQDVYALGRSVFVYGDDLIVPADEASAICDDLEAFGFRVNRRKSFWNGKFRESCGSDCYDGVHVTPVYMRRDLPTDRKDASAIVSCVATANQLSKAGYSAAATALRKAVELVVGKLPSVHETSAAIGWFGISYAVPPERWNKHLQRREFLAWVPVTSRSPDPLEGDPALVKCLLGLRENPSWRFDPLADFACSKDHLEMSSRPYSLTLKRRWVPASEMRFGMS